MGAPGVGGIMDDPFTLPSSDEEDNEEQRAAKHARLAPAAPPPPVVVGTPAAPLVVGARVEECVDTRPALPADAWCTVRRDGKDVEVLALRVNADGGVWGGCHSTCKNRCVDIERFVPAANKNTNFARQRCLATLADLRMALRSGDWDAVAKLRKDVERLRTGACDVCRGHMNKISMAKRACLDEYDCMRMEMCRKQNGCANLDCPERGMAAWIVLTTDHGTNPKNRNMSHCCWWSSNGGIHAMRKEAEKIHQWICGCCHALEPTSNQGSRVNNPNTMARKPDETEQKFRDRKLMTAIRFFPSMSTSMRASAQ